MKLVVGSVLILYPFAHSIYFVPDCIMALCLSAQYLICFCLLLYSLDTLMTLATFSLEAQLAVPLAVYTVRTTQYIDVFDKKSKQLLCLKI